MSGDTKDIVGYETHPNDEPSQHLQETHEIMSPMFHINNGITYMLDLCRKTYDTLQNIDETTHFIHTHPRILFLSNNPTLSARPSPYNGMPRYLTLNGL